MPDDASYEDVIRQLRILQSIDWTVRDVEVGGHPGEPLVERAREDLDRTPDGRYPRSQSPIVLRSRPVFNWQSLAETDDDAPLFKRAAWIY